MPGFALLIRTYDGIVAIADKENSRDQVTGIIKINKNTIALVFGGLEHVKTFCSEHFKDITDDHDVIKICEVAKDKFQQHGQKYKKTDFSFVIVSFAGLRSTLFYGLWFNAGTQVSEALSDAHIFTQKDEDLAQYLVNKVYSDHMFVGELVKLASFVTLQCIKIFRIGTDFDFVTLSEKEVKWLTSGEIKDQLHAQEKIDYKLKKKFSDFFLSEADCS